MSYAANGSSLGEQGVITLQEDRVYTQRRGNETVIRVDDDPTKPVEPAFAAQTQLLHEFYEAVTQGKSVATTCQDNIKSLGIVFNVIKSCETGLPVRRGESSK